MQVNDAVETVVLGLAGNPVTNCTEVVADVFITGGLDARKDARHTRTVPTGLRVRAGVW